jgi:hypothetical protein
MELLAELKLATDWKFDMETKEPRIEVFERIYRNHAWGGVSRSGPGSDPIFTKPYIHFINSWLASHPEVRTIVELGCGDWSTTSQIELGERDYLGIDIVSSVVEENARRFGSARVRFLRSDFVGRPPPPADLLLAKDVLQHLSNASVLKFLQSSLGLCRFAIITNDSSRIAYKPIFFGIRIPRRLDVPNQDIDDGGSRSVRLREPPFNVSASEQAFYKVVLHESPVRIVYVKEIVVCG